MQEKIKQLLEDEFGTKVQIQGETVKTTVPQLNGNSIMGLAKIYQMEDVQNVNVKRSGTSVTVLVRV